MALVNMWIPSLELASQERSQFIENINKKSIGSLGLFIGLRLWPGKSFGWTEMGDDSALDGWGCLQADDFE
jgi:hypothetical protein